MYIYKSKSINDLNSFNDQARALVPKVSVVMKFGDDNLRFTLSEAITEDENIAINGLLIDFVDSDLIAPVPKIVGLAKGEASLKHFHNINYKKEMKSSLIPKRTTLRGEVTRVEWYSEIDAYMQLSNLVLTVDIEYVRSSGFAISRTTTRSWINEDGSINGESKVTTKYYAVNHQDMIDEGIKRRRCLVNGVQMPVLSCMKEYLGKQGYSDEAVTLKARSFMDIYDQEFSKFIDNSSTITTPADPNYGEKSIVVRLSDAEVDGFNAGHNDWLDSAPGYIGGETTVRAYLTNEFSI